MAARTQCECGRRDVGCTRRGPQRAVVGEAGRIDRQRRGCVVVNHAVIDPATTTVILTQVCAALHGDAAGNGHHTAVVAAVVVERATGSAQCGSCTRWCSCCQPNVGRNTFEVERAVAGIEVHPIGQQQVLPNVE